MPPRGASADAAATPPPAQPLAGAAGHARADRPGAARPSRLAAGAARLAARAGPERCSRLAARTPARGERTVVGANKAAAALFGQQPAAKPIEASLRDPGLLAAVDEALEEHGEAQLTIQLPGAPPRAFGVLVVPVRLRRQAAALVGLRELTEQLMIERMRSDFVANASHELRTPLTALRGFIDTLAGPARDDPEARERFLKTMAGEAARMSRLVDDLLSLSRIEQSEHRRPSERVDLTDCLETVVRSLLP